MAIMLGANKPKFQYGSLKVKKIYKGTTQVYSSGNVCNYYVNGSLVHTQEYDEGQSVLSPAYTIPSVSGRVFKGWSTTNGGQPASSLTMGDSPISLYARFNYVVTYNFNGRNYTQEYATGANVLSPSVVSPAITDATFLGWVTSPSATTPLTSLTMGSDPIMLYALFKWNDASYTFGQIFFRAHQHQGDGNPSYYVPPAAASIPLNRYGSYSFYCGSSGSRIGLTLTTTYYWSGAVISCGFRVNGNMYFAVTIDSIEGAYDSKEKSYVGKNVSGIIDSGATGEFIFKLEIVGSNGFASGFANFDGSPALILHGKTTTI